MLVRPSKIGVVLDVIVDNAADNYITEVYKYFFFSRKFC